MYIYYLLCFILYVLYIDILRYGYRERQGRKLKPKS